MFGEEKIFGQSEAKVDDKKRLVLPTYTKREKGDKLVLLEDKELNIFRIYTTEKIGKIFDELNKQLINSKTDEDIKINKKKLYDLSKSILKSYKIDKSGRFTVGDIFEEYAKIKFIGACDHLILELKK